MQPLNFIGLYVITDNKKVENVEFAKKVIAGGGKIIQLREKDKAKAVEIGRKLKILTEKNGVILIINDWPDVAKTINADGVHLGQKDMPIYKARKLLGRNKIIGVSTHNVKEALEAEQKGADYIGIGPIYKTKKKNYNPVGLKIIEEVKKKIHIPFVAIGGINDDNIDEVLAAGAKNIAMISAISKENNIKEKVEFLTKKIKGD
jgi:thiamine-phosphate pyrophosphorylase|tara:strand:- start:1976 stop:2587 length:612 start_codon:yes stop_codon:yes gene_type:complete